MERTWGEVLLGCGGVMIGKPLRIYSIGEDQKEENKVDFVEMDKSA